MQKLSPLQIYLLDIINDLYKNGCEYHSQYLSGFVPWNLGWWYKRRGKPFTRSQHAASSRAIRRLEKRGLIECRRVIGGSNRSFALKLTEAGQEVVNIIKKTGNETVNNNQQVNNIQNSCC
jgi:hypothetical protein